MKKIIFGLMVCGAALLANDIYATFSVQASKSASLAFSGSGIVNKVNVDVGEMVHKGEVLATLQSDDIKAGLEAAQVALKYAKKSYDRMQSIKEVTDQTKLDGAAFKYESAKAQVAYKQALLDKTILRAPFDGVISMKNIEVGDTLSGVRLMTVFKIQSVHARKLIVEFDQKYWKSVKPGLTFVYTVDGDPGQHKGKIVKVYPLADPKNRKIKAEVPATDIPAGLFGEGSIATPSGKQQREN
jgi:RND family efflux transporter MFP subunit